MNLDALRTVAGATRPATCSDPDPDLLAFAAKFDTATRRALEAEHRYAQTGETRRSRPGDLGHVHANGRPVVNGSCGKQCGGCRKPLRALNETCSRCGYRNAWRGNRDCGRYEG